MQIIDAIVRCLPIITCVVLLYNMRKFTSNILKTIVTMYFVFQAIWSSLLITNDIAVYCQLITLKYIISLSCYIAQVIVCVVNALFFKYRLGLCYQHTFLAINKLFINICVGIYTSTILIRQTFMY